MPPSSAPEPFSVEAAYSLIRRQLDAAPNSASPSAAALLSATPGPDLLPERGLGDQATVEHLVRDITPALNGTKLSSNYYGFITGGVLPVAETADNIVTAWDQNVQVHLPDCSVATAVEDRALDWLDQLIRLSSEQKAFRGRIFTTGATGSNILGLACGRESVVSKQLQRRGLDVAAHGVNAQGLLGASRAAGIDDIQVLTTLGHSSLYKAASVVGIGRSNVLDVGDSSTPWKFDLSRLESALSRPSTASIVALSWGEVNTGRFSTSSLAEVQQIRRLCDQHGAWLHVDAAFAFPCRYLPASPEFAALRRCSEGLELADSITGDAHKLLNVPYDCGFFYTHDLAALSAVFSNGNAAYLLSAAASSPAAPASASAAAAAAPIPSPLNIGLENSRRFRALPVYAVLLSLGQHGLRDLFVAQVQLARRIARYVLSQPAYELLPSGSDAGLDETSIVVLFRAKHEAQNAGLVRAINADGRIYVTGTQWDGRPAVRLAVSTWRVDIERDLRLVTAVLDAAVA